jgi:hypothetical protein
MTTGADSACPRGGDNEPVMDARTTPARLREAARQAVRDARLPSGPPLRPTRRAWQFDVLVALTLGIATVYYGIDNVDNVVVREIAPGVERVLPRPSGPGGLALMVTLAAIASSALALRRRYPLAVLCIVTAATLATPQSVMRLTFYAFVIAVYSAAVYSPYRVATLAALPVSVALVGTSGNSVTPIVPNEYIALLILSPWPWPPSVCVPGNSEPTRAAPGSQPWNANRPRRCAGPSSMSGPGSPANCTTSSRTTSA